MLHRLGPAFKEQELVQSFCELTFRFLGGHLRLENKSSAVDPRHDVVVEQQHCGGSTLVVFRALLLPKKDFVIISRRHRGYPFSLTFFVDGVLDARLSACCEYKHQSGYRLGGRNGHFGVLAVRGSAPCYKCQVERGLNISSAPPQPKWKFGNKTAKSIPKPATTPSQRNEQDSAANEVPTAETAVANYRDDFDTEESGPDDDDDGGRRPSGGSATPAPAGGGAAPPIDQHRDDESLRRGATDGDKESSATASEESAGGQRSSGEAPQPSHHPEVRRGPEEPDDEQRLDLTADTPAIAVYEDDFERDEANDSDNRPESPEARSGGADGGGEEQSEEHVQNPDLSDDVGEAGEEKRHVVQVLSADSRDSSSSSAYVATSSSSSSPSVTCSEFLVSSSAQVFPSMKSDQMAPDQRSAAKLSDSSQEAAEGSNSEATVAADKPEAAATDRNSTSQDLEAAQPAAAGTADVIAGDRTEVFITQQQQHQAESADYGEASSHDSKHVSGLLGTEAAGSLNSNDMKDSEERMLGSELQVARDVPRSIAKTADGETTAALHGHDNSEGSVDSKNVGNNEPEVIARDAPSTGTGQINDDGANGINESPETTGRYNASFADEARVDGESITMNTAVAELSLTEASQPREATESDSERLATTTEIPAADKQQQGVEGLPVPGGDMPTSLDSTLHAVTEHDLLTKKGHCEDGGTTSDAGSEASASLSHDHQDAETEARFLGRSSIVQSPVADPDPLADSGIGLATVTASAALANSSLDCDYVKDSTEKEEHVSASIKPTDQHLPDPVVDENLETTAVASSAAPLLGVLHDDTNSEYLPNTFGDVTDVESETIISAVEHQVLLDGASERTRLHPEAAAVNSFESSEGNGSVEMPGSCEATQSMEQREQVPTLSMASITNAELLQSPGGTQPALPVIALEQAAASSMADEECPAVAEPFAEAVSAPSPSSLVVPTSSVMAAKASFPMSSFVLQPESATSTMAEPTEGNFGDHRTSLSVFAPGIDTPMPESFQVHEDSLGCSAERSAQQLLSQNWSTTEEGGGLADVVVRLDPLPLATSNSRANQNTGSDSDVEQDQQMNELYRGVNRISGALDRLNDEPSIDLSPSLAVKPRLAGDISNAEPESEAAARSSDSAMIAFTESASTSGENFLGEMAIRDALHGEAQHGVGGEGQSQPPPAADAYVGVDNDVLKETTTNLDPTPSIEQPVDDGRSNRSDAAGTVSADEPAGSLMTPPSHAAESQADPKEPVNLVHSGDEHEPRADALKDTSQHEESISEQRSDERHEIEDSTHSSDSSATIATESTGSSSLLDNYSIPLDSSIAAAAAAVDPSVAAAIRDHGDARGNSVDSAYAYDMRNSAYEAADDISDDSAAAAPISGGDRVEKTTDRSVDQQPAAVGVTAADSDTQRHGASENSVGLGAAAVDSERQAAPGDGEGPQHSSLAADGGGHLALATLADAAPVLHDDDQHSAEESSATTARNGRTAEALAGAEVVAAGPAEPQPDTADLPEDGEKDKVAASDIAVAGGGDGMHRVFVQIVGAAKEEKDAAESVGPTAASAASDASGELAADAAVSGRINEGQASLLESI